MVVKVSDAFATQGGDASQSQSMNAGNFIDGAGNEVVAIASSTFSTLTATNHNFKGATPTFLFLTQNAGASAAATAAAMSVGTVGATQYTPAGTANLNNVIAGVF